MCVCMYVYYVYTYFEQEQPLSRHLPLLRTSSYFRFVDIVQTLISNMIIINNFTEKFYP